MDSLAEAKSERSVAALMNTWRSSNLGKWNVTNFRVTDTPHYTARLTIPGLSHESFDVDGNPKMTSIMLTSVMSRIYALHRPDPETGNVFLDWTKLMDDRFSFVSSTEFKLSQALYNRDIPKWPLDAKYSLGAVGNSSYCNVIEFFLPGEETNPLWSNITQLVSVDKTMRKPSSLPDWFKDKYKGKGVFEKGLVIKPFQRPENTYCHKTQVNWSDTDNYKHTNFASYVRFAIDSLHAALRTNQVSNHGKTPESESCGRGQALQSISKEIIANGLKNVQICYLNETLEGHTLDVHVWQQSAEENIVYCAIERDGGDVCQLKLEYFDTREW